MTICMRALPVMNVGARRVAPHPCAGASAAKTRAAAVIRHRVREHRRYGLLRTHRRGGMSAPTIGLGPGTLTAVHSLYAAGYGCEQGEAARGCLRLERGFEERK